VVEPDHEAPYHHPCIYYVGVACYSRKALAGPLCCAALLYNRTKQETVGVAVYPLSPQAFDSHPHVESAAESGHRQALRQLRQQHRELIPSQVTRVYVADSLAGGLGEQFGPVTRVDLEPRTPEPEVVELARAEAQQAFYRATDAYASRYPAWGFEDHRGEDTPEHRKVLKQKRTGLPNVHRFVYRPLCTFGRGRTVQHGQLTLPSRAQERPQRPRRRPFRRSEASSRPATRFESPRRRHHTSPAHGTHETSTRKRHYELEADGTDEGFLLPPPPPPPLALESIHETL